ncbi:CinA family protein [Cellulomonas sp. PhB143]|uniref:CinA family protein n=1 Tax=Cellulomonas sp. PhB143 TaxID=2485186 RepID=UPI000FBD5644|nr:CinA family protein [Cellulomonas sp. PhB143]ROS77164.1 nicotinamide-nucleotide amidase [Cellulomonas sp. PhB143]
MPSGPTVPSGPPAPGELAAAVLSVLRERGLTLGTAESLTGGLLASTLVDVPGASDVLRGGVVAYATEVKASVLGVDAALLAARGAVDPDVALAMARGACEVLGADIGVATTGVAGPEPQDGAAVGTVYVAVHAVPGPARGAVAGTPLVRRAEHPGDRAAVRGAAVTDALVALLDSCGPGTSRGPGALAPS